uniref:Uncharacterized protein n=1 Tax=Knipowitschia caucasica TaxID=637954 RepID=A0AAV2J2B1_KNICA
MSSISTFEYYETQPLEVRVYSPCLQSVDFLRVVSDRGGNEICQPPAQGRISHGNTDLRVCGGWGQGPGSLDRKSTESPQRVHKVQKKSKESRESLWRPSGGPLEDPLETLMEDPLEALMEDPLEALWRPSGGTLEDPL